MLDIKELLAKILDKITTVTVTVTGTTNANGAISVAAKVPTTANIVCIKPNNSTHMAIPFYYYNGDWHAKVVDWRTLANVSNTSVTLTIRYLK